MGKKTHDDVLSAGAQMVKDNCTVQVALSAEPTDYADAIGAKKLAQATMAPGDFTIGDLAAGGRELTVAEKLAQPVTASGTMTHAALLDVGNSRLLHTTTTDSTALTSGHKVDFPEWKSGWSDPA